MTRPTPLSLENPLVKALLPFWQWRKLWIGSVLGFAIIGLIYAVAKSDTWVATQGLIVRDEATGGVMRLGRFESQTQMKAAQEMILEIARSPQVVGEALATLGRPPRFFGWLKSDSPYSIAEIESFARDCVSVRAPRGAELGTTEVIYLEIKQRSQERAVQLAASLCNSLERQLQEVRRARADGIILELQAALTVSEAELERATEKLKQIELNAGADLADLRGLTDANSGSTNRLMLDLVRDDRRKCEMELQVHRENLAAVQVALVNPDQLMQITDRLTESQPTIKKLREGLAEAALRTAQLQGRFADSHADVIIARNTEQQFRENLSRELQNSGLAIQGAIELCLNRLAKLNEQELELGKSLNRLADIRADYTNLVSEVRATNEEVQKIKREMTQAMAARNAASASSLITRINQPQLGDRPIGPGRMTIVGSSLIGGLFFGLGVVFMLTPIPSMAGTGNPAREGNSQVRGNQVESPLPARSNGRGHRGDDSYGDTDRDHSGRGMAECEISGWGNTSHGRGSKGHTCQQHASRQGVCQDNCRHESTLDDDTYREDMLPESQSHSSGANRHNHANGSSIASSGTSKAAADPAAMRKQTHSKAQPIPDARPASSSAVEPTPKPLNEHSSPSPTPKGLEEVQSIIAQALQCQAPQIKGATPTKAPNSSR